DQFRAVAEASGFRVFNGVVSDASGGVSGISRISIAQASGGTAEIAADTLAMSGGWNPSVGLSSHQRGRPTWRDDIAAFVPGDCPPGMTVSGAANGDFS
ncbi:hypothetical protein, partial [Mesorhizobium sp. M4B.F.Ca.ET.200.01.1.1]